MADLQTPTGHADEPTISFRWSDNSHPDLLPQRFFAKEGVLREQIHLVGSRAGKRAEAKCDVRVKGIQAELDYEPYADFNRSQGMLLGVARLTFSDDTRSKIVSAEWKEQGRSDFKLSAPMATSVNSPTQPAVGGRNYFRVMLGKRSAHAAECFAGGFIGADFGIDEDLSKSLPDDWREFNQRYIPVYLAKHPGKTKIGAGLACGFLWTVSRGIKVGDLVLCPDGGGRYRIGEVAGEYSYAPGQILPHRRPVRWSDTYVARESMSEGLRNSAGSIGTVSFLSRSGHQAELDKLIGAIAAPILGATDQTVEDPTVFGLEKHLEDFLVQNWKQTELGKRYDLFEDEDGNGQQYPTDTGPIDILAVSKDKKELLVVELKKGRASDAVVGQVQRYMGYIIDEVAEENQKVRGIIIALEDDQRIRRALRVAQNIEFFRYEVSFRLFKA